MQDLGLKKSIMQEKRHTQKNSRRITAAGVPQNYKSYFYYEE
jgi:hypothetical protein